MPRGRKKKEVVEETKEEVKIVEETKVEEKKVPDGWTASTNARKRRQKLRENAPEGTQEPVEESKPAPVRRKKKKTEEKKEVEEKPKKPNPWRLHLSKTFANNKGKTFKEVMSIAKSSYTKK
jgi:hypothetical protein